MTDDEELAEARARHDEREAARTGDDDVKLALLRLCAKGERLLDVATYILAKEAEKHYKMPEKWDRVVEESGLEADAKEKLRAIVQQVLEEKEGPA